MNWLEIQTDSPLKDGLLVLETTRFLSLAERFKQTSGCTQCP